MGWKESPPAFLGATDTITNLANLRTIQCLSSPEHQLEKVANAPADGHCNKGKTPVHALATNREHANRPVAHVDAHVDDLIRLAQGMSLTALVSQAMLHSMDNAFRPVEPLDNPNCQEPASCKKLVKGDRHMAVKKTILGWDINSRQMTTCLTNCHLARLKELLDSIPQSRKHLPVKEWHKALGELRSMMMASPGSRGLFSALQLCFWHCKTRMWVKTLVHNFLDDFQWLVQHLAECSMRICELVPAAPNIVGATNAAGEGMGGMCFAPLPNSTDKSPLHEALTWRSTFPPEIMGCLLTHENPHGFITNSDLELTATVAHHNVIASRHGVVEATIATLHNNFAMVMWNCKGSATAKGPAACLLRLETPHLQHC